MLNSKQKLFRRRFGFFLLSVFPLAGVFKFVYPNLPGTICIFKTVTGKQCPFCGLSRSFSQAIYGEFQKAFAFHPLWWLAALLIMGSIGILLYEGFTGNDQISAYLKLKQNFYWIFIGFAAITLIVRRI